MNSLMKHKQQGATLLVGMVMLVVLTLLVVFAIRSGNTNVRIAGNMQSQTEAAAATQLVIEQVVQQIALPDIDISTIGAQSITVPIGNSTYTVDVASMANKCVFTTPVLNSSLSTANPNDVPCFATADTDMAVKSTGVLESKPSACNTQQWEIQATATDNVSGVQVSEVQAITVRVPASTTCM